MKKLLWVCSLLCVAVLLFACTPSVPPVDSEGQATEEELALETVVISPLPQSIALDDLQNATVAVSLEKGGVYQKEDGTYAMDVKVYGYDMYDMVDVAGLKEGDTMVRLETEVSVTSVEHLESGLIRINGGVENGGFDLMPGDTVFYEVRENDAKAYYELGAVTLDIAEGFVFTDASNLDEEPIAYTAAELAAEDADIMYFFIPNNTSIVIENGAVTQLNRIYIP